MTKISQPSTTERAEIEDLVHQDKKIQAIKMYRQATGSSLREAKMLVEHFESTGRWSIDATESPIEVLPEQSNNTTSQHRQQFGVGYWMVVLGLLGLLGWHFLS